jgi:predicted dehydrogenase
MKKTRIAIVGAGRIAHVHTDAYLAMPDVAVVAVADPDGERAELLARRADADALKDYAALLSRDDIEAIDVCTPTVFHEEITIAALKAGKHVCCSRWTLGPATA